jgi:biotin carboxyl carrier protein
MQYEVEVNGRLRQVNVNRTDGRFVVSLDGREWRLDAARIDAYTLSLLIDESRGPAAPAGGEIEEAASATAISSHEVTVTTESGSGQITATVGAVPVRVALNGRRRWTRSDGGASGGAGPQRLLAPMPGKIVRILVATGQAVKQRQPLVVVEAMKMENELRAAADGIVTELHVQEGQSVDAGTLLAVLGLA